MSKSNSKVSHCGTLLKRYYSHQAIHYLNIGATNTYILKNEAFTSKNLRSFLIESDVLVNCVVSKRFTVQIHMWQSLITLESGTIKGKHKIDQKKCS